MRNWIDSVQECSIETLGSISHGVWVLYIYTRDTLPHFAVAQCGWMDEKSLYSRKLCFWHLSVSPFPTPTFTGVRGAHKQYQRYNYSYHRVQNSYQLFRKPWFDTNVDILLFLHVTPSYLVHISAKSAMILNYKKLSWRLIDWLLSVPLTMDTQIRSQLKCTYVCEA